MKKKERKLVKNRYGKTVDKAMSEAAYDAAMSGDYERDVDSMHRTESDRISEGFEMLDRAGDWD